LLGPSPGKGINAKDADKSLIKEPFVMDVEAEADRQLLVKKIIDQINNA
jgi:hypothetical protein